MFPLDIRDRVMNMLNIFWTSRALGYIIFVQMDTNWIHHVAFLSDLLLPYLVDFIISYLPLNLLRKKNIFSSLEKKLLIEQRKNSGITSMTTSCSNRAITYLRDAITFILAWKVCKSSMISHQVVLLVLDKHSATEELKYL